MNVIITCGGTGGHIYPGIAIADKIKKENPDANILFIGTKTGMENQLVPSAGYEIAGIDARGFDRKHLLNNFKTIKDVLLGSSEVTTIINEFKPDIAIGTGGYVTGPVLLQAKKHGIPCYVHEQNALPGIANKMISSFADKVFISFEGTEEYFKHPDRAVLSGNPVRAEFASLEKLQCRAELNLNQDDRIVLIFGGSLGAQVINTEAIQLIQRIEEQNRKIKVFFVTGNRYYDEIKEIIDEDNDGMVPNHVTLLAYAYNMPQLMAASDIVVCRSGAIAVSEVAALGKPSVLIPSPNVTANHQFYNAKALADKGAAVLLEEKDLLSEEKDLSEEIFHLIDNPDEMRIMSEAAKAMGTTAAVDVIYNNLKICQTN